MSDPLDSFFDPQPTRQRLQIIATFRHKLSPVAPLLLDSRIKTLVAAREGITIEGEATKYPVVRQKWRHWRYQIDFIIINTTAWHDFETFKHQVYSLLDEQRPREYGIDITNIAEQ